MPSPAASAATLGPLAFVATTRRPAGRVEVEAVDGCRTVVCERVDRVVRAVGGRGWVRGLGPRDDEADGPALVDALVEDMTGSFDPFTGR